MTIAFYIVSIFLLILVYFYIELDDKCDTLYQENRDLKAEIGKILWEIKNDRRNKPKS